MEFSRPILLCRETVIRVNEREYEVSQVMPVISVKCGAKEQV